MTLRTIDESTGEVLRPEERRLEQIANMLADIPDAQAIEAGALCEDLAEFYRSMAGKFKDALLSRMQERGATKLMTPEGWIAERTSKTEWAWDTAALLTKVRPLLPAQVFADCVPFVEPEPLPPPQPYYKPSTVKLKALAKALSDEYAAIVLGCARQDETNVKVKLVAP